MSEIWKPIPGYEGLYEASSRGRVRSVNRVVVSRRKPGNSEYFRHIPGRILSLNIGPHGYILTCLSKDGKSKTSRVNRLVCSAFYGERPEYVFACHNDGNKANNSAYNLRWDTPASNQADRIIHGTALIGEDCPAAKLTDRQVDAIRGLIELGTPTKEIAPRFGVTDRAVRDIRAGRTWAKRAMLEAEIALRSPSLSKGA